VATRPLTHALTIKTNKSDESNLNQNTYINQNKLQKQKLKFTEQNLSISIRCNVHSEAFVNKASTSESGIAFQISITLCKKILTCINVKVARTAYKCVLYYLDSLKTSRSRAHV